MFIVLFKSFNKKKFFTFDILLECKLSTTAKYSIKDLEILTDIKSHTIRIWEKRYNILQPERTETNIRYYSNEDLKVLLNVSFLNQKGYKISKIAEMSESQRSELVISLTQSSQAYALYIDQLIISMIDLNEVYFRKLFNQAVEELGLEETFILVIFPFLERIGVMWQTGAINPAQEHFISHLIRHRIIAEIEFLKVTTNESLPKVLLLLPGNELHEIALLLYYHALKKRSFPTLYLGQSVPVDSLDRIVEIAQPKIIVAHLTNGLNHQELQLLVDQFSVLNTDIILSGYATQYLDVSKYSNFKIIDSIKSFISILKGYSK